MTPATVISADPGKTDSHIIQEAKRIISAYEAAGGFDYTIPPSGEARAIASEARACMAALSHSPALFPVYDILHRIAFGVPA